MKRPFKTPIEAARAVARLAREEGGRMAERIGDRLLRRGAWRTPLRFPEDRTALLFFEDLEADRWLRGDRFPRRAARRLYHAVTRGQAMTGFEVAFRALVRALERSGWRVVVNDRALARRNPRHPIGLAGYPHVLPRWDLPNPAVLGPGLLDHPAEAPRLLDDPRFGTYLVHSDWVKAIFERGFGRACTRWFAGLDLDAWPDLSSAPKDLDLLVYDKFHWERERRETELLQPLLAEAARRGLRVEVLRYGRYQVPEYRALLARTRGLLWLSEHETQGIAYQEAMASNVPVLAWDQGWWLDPGRTRWEAEPVAASSVPYFSPECGERFADAGQFPSALDRFLAGLPRYTPRRYVAAHLSLEASARIWLEAAASVAR